MTRVSTLSVIVALGGLACAAEPIVGEDVMPLDGAFHLSEMGQAEAFGRNPDAKPTTARDEAKRDPFGGLQSALREQWVHREIHAAEGIDPRAVMQLLREELAGAHGRGGPRARPAEAQGR